LSLARPNSWWILRSTFASADSGAVRLNAQMTLWIPPCGA
jgi:hypothetical protein